MVVMMRRRMTMMMMVMAKAMTTVMKKRSIRAHIKALPDSGSPGSSPIVYCPWAIP